MLSKQKSWISSQMWKPKNFHSLEYLKYLYTFLTKNPQVTEQNRDALVEALRSISEILIWGDQNDNAVFDFFLEKNMLSYFLFFMRQRSGNQLCVQLLQTLNILFENISNQTSLYYLLSNNHVNSIIEHKFDFSDEEVMAYYISFLKTLSFKLNKHTIHFFYNEHANDFALYTEAIKFFNHSESMVRIAVRTITLNVFRVEDKAMLKFICNRTAVPYFANLVWFIGNHVLEMDACVRQDVDHSSRDRLADLVAEHLDHLHYLNDVLCLRITSLNEVLSDQLLDRLLLPLYVYSLVKRSRYTPRSDEKPYVSSIVALFLLSQVFLIISHAPLVRRLAEIILKGELDVYAADPSETEASSSSSKTRSRGFRKPDATLAETLNSSKSDPLQWVHLHTQISGSEESAAESEEQEVSGDAVFQQSTTDGCPAGEEGATFAQFLGQNSTDEEKLMQNPSASTSHLSLKDRPYLEAIFSALDCSEGDYEVLFSLCLLYALGRNQGVNQELLDSIQFTTNKSLTKEKYNILLVDKIIEILVASCETGSKIRLATLELAVIMIKMIVVKDGRCYLLDRHLAAVEGAKEEATLQLRNFYKSEEIFLDMFEDEFRDMKNRPLNVEHLTMDASVLLPPTGTPLTGIDFIKRLPCGEVERARKAIRVFFMLRDLSLNLRQEIETDLPLTKEEECVRLGDVLDLNNSDLIACSLLYKDNRKERRFLVIDILQLILVEPDSKKLGWGIVKFVGLLQDAEVTGDKEDSRSLHITVHKPSMNAHTRPLPLLSARFVFDDHIRCMAAKQRLTKGRLKARQRKMQMIAHLLDLPASVIDVANSPQPSHTTVRSKSVLASGIPGRSQPVASLPRRASTPKSTGDGSRSPTVTLDKMTALRRAQAAKAARHKQSVISSSSEMTMSSVQSVSSGIDSRNFSESTNSVQSGSELAHPLAATCQSTDNAQTVNNDDMELLQTSREKILNNVAVDQEEETKTSSPTHLLGVTENKDTFKDNSSDQSEQNISHISCKDEVIELAGKLDEYSLEASDADLSKVTSNSFSGEDSIVHEVNLLEEQNLTKDIALATAASLINPATRALEELETLANE